MVLHGAVCCDMGRCNGAAASHFVHAVCGILGATISNPHKIACSALLQRVEAGALDGVHKRGG